MIAGQTFRGGATRTRSDMRVCGGKFGVVSRLALESNIHRENPKQKNVIPAKAGTQLSVRVELGPGFRRDDGLIFLLSGQQAHPERLPKNSTFCGCGLRLPRATLAPRSRHYRRNHRNPLCRLACARTIRPSLLKPGNCFTPSTCSRWKRRA